MLKHRDEFVLYSEVRITMELSYVETVIWYSLLYEAMSLTLSSFVLEPKSF